MDGYVRNVIATVDADTNNFYVIDPFTAKRSEVGVIRPMGACHTSGLTPMRTGMTTFCRLVNGLWAEAAAPVRSNDKKK